ERGVLGRRAEHDVRARVVRVAVFRRRRHHRYVEAARLRPLVACAGVVDPVVGGRVVDGDEGADLGLVAAVFVGELAGVGVHLQPPEDVLIGAWGRCGAGEDLHARAARAGCRGPRAGVDTDLSLDQPGGRREVLNGQALVYRLHDLVPDGGRAQVAGQAVHRAVIRVADPHADGVLRREPDGPDVAVIVGGAGLDGGGPVAAQLQRRAIPEFVRPRVGVGQDVRDQVGVFRADDLLPGDVLLRLEDQGAAAVLDAADG